MNKSMISKNNNLDKIKQKARAWVKNEDGLNKIINSVKEAHEVTDHLKEERKVEPEKLREPFNI